MPDSSTYDCVIVGGGSAGCVLANRLTANGRLRVLLLEAGGRDRNPWIHIPVGYFKTMHNPALDWCFRTEPDPGLNGRSLDWPRGKVLGGSSSINGLLYVRGQPEDYDRWRQMGNTGWSWDNLLPLFRDAETFAGGADAYRGDEGPLGVIENPVRREITEAWKQAALAAGYRTNPDYNGVRQEGIGDYQITSRNGRRCSAAVAFLNPARKRSNLHIRTGVLVRRLLFEGRRATGLEIRTAAGRIETVQATREIVLSAGAIGTPHILMHSGIGDPEHLTGLGIPMTTALPGVGQNLQDHLQARVVWTCRSRTLNDDVNSVFRRMKMALDYALFRSGPMTMSASFVAGFVKSHEHMATPDIQILVQPWSADSVGKGVHKFPAFTASVCQLRPESRGHLRLTSPDPGDYPAIHPNYLATKTDQKTVVDAVRIVRNIATHEPLRSLITAEFQPGETLQEEDSILDWVRNTAVTIFHPSGTCRMGPGADAVVDDRLRVKSIGNLRVADCSIMPELVSGNTNAAALMIGEKASRMILEDLKAPGIPLSA
ncbi:MAG: GMC family oxidoreductase N-terminal domain-containing protein [Rhodobacteraceae bacterium]|nr:GMC family oxidoreductase N-terminal domain-containing protein [Paracoccaceae bacterium]